MWLNSIFIRFYKSFNYDSKRERNPEVKQKRWEIMEDGRWFPYIQIELEPKITTIVGANESGKSQLLSAIEKAISGKDDSGEKVTLEDLCRYSPFFTVESEKSQLSDFGCEWSDLSEKDQGKVKKFSTIPADRNFEKMIVFRTNGNDLTIFLSEGEEEYSKYEVKKDCVEEFSKFLPRTFRIYNNIALPGSVPIKKLVQLIKKPNATKTTRYEVVSPEQREEARKLIDEICNTHFTKSESRDSYGNPIKPDYSGTVKSLFTILHQERNLPKEEEIELAYKLICKIAGVKSDILLELSDHLKSNKKGYTNGWIDMINDKIATHLNFPEYWVQDKQFRLQLSATEHDLIFTIRDKTGTQYSFNERSNGLKYFLSYYIQCRSHESEGENPEILLMDEPDTYLSSQGQQDLLKIFEELANPNDDKPPVQIIYVTHSPFLIDKNHSERIRVLNKGDGYEGTKVIRRNAQNHYEPLRSAFGAFVGETVFIGNCNLMVEGPVDQILLAGAATYLRAQGVSEQETLDLNQITIVPAGGATHVPYLVYLARGRDANRPAVIVLLDGDDEGNDVKKRLTRKGYGPREKAPLKEEFILQISDLDKKDLSLNKNILPIEIEDLIPLRICVMAAQKYAHEICQANRVSIETITEEAIINKIKEDNKKTVFDALIDCFKELPPDGFNIEKNGLAKNVIEIVNKLSKQKEHFDNKEGTLSQALEGFKNNFKILFRNLEKRKRAALREVNKERTSQQADSLVQQFIDKYPLRADRGQALVLIEEIENLIQQDQTLNKENEIIESIIQDIKSFYNLESAMAELVDPYPKFLEDLKRIKDAGSKASEENQENELDDLFSLHKMSTSPDSLMEDKTASQSEKKIINKPKEKADKQNN